jgi:hypothetical protein
MHPINTPKLFLFSIGLLLAAATAPADNVTLHWLDGAPPAVPSGVSWGVPWPRGTVQKDQTFSLTAANGQSLPLQSWTLAYWPDGSIKWTGFATVANSVAPGNLTLAPVATSANPTVALTANDTANFIQINTGPLQCVISKTGSNGIDWLAVNGTTVAQAGQLVCILQNGPDGNPEDSPPPREKFTSTVKKVTLEQSGPVRAVVKIEGLHKGAQSGREWLPFTVRLYFYAGETAVRLVHTIIFDGDQGKDFIRGLGVTFAVPMHEDVFNRHVRFTGEDGGLFAEPIQPGAGNSEQAEGRPINGGRGYGAPTGAPTGGRGGANDTYAIFNDFKLMQPTPDGFTIIKRTNPQSTWLNANAGKRSTGLAFVGDTSGGLAISVKNFWQSYPDSLEVQNAGGPAAQLTAWLWSPDGPEMDMRHYDTIAHGLGLTYEDVQIANSTAYGIGHTSELTLYPTADVPSKADTVALADANAIPPMLACTPEYMHSTGVFGYWSLKDTSTPFKKTIEDGLDSVLAFYEKQVGERHWYGFWDYGDFIHSYNNPEHTWYYDYGGHAWDNTELGAPLWLWYSYMRSGRADLFRLAEAHTRDTSETNVYHLGPMMGLGTRHNVVKWGDGAKEARISQDAHWRFYYYLTTDERVGDIMRDNLQADAAVAKFDPMREAQPITDYAKQFPGRIRTGPDWFALAGNWMTEWERTGNTTWRDRILVGVKDMAKMPYGIRTGQNLVKGWNPVTADLYPLDNVAGQYNLATIQGGAEVAMELSTILDDPDWQRLWLQYCRLLTAPADVVTLDNTTHTEGGQAQYYGNGGGNPDSIARLAGYAYLKTKNAAFAQVAIDRGIRNLNFTPREVDVPEALNPVTEGRTDTNGASQSSLNTIVVLELVKDSGLLPTDAAAADNFVVRAGGRGGRGGAGAPAAPTAPNARAAAPANAPTPTATVPAN